MDVTHSFAFPFLACMCVPCLSHTCAMPISYVCHSSFICVPCLIRKCVMTHPSTLRHASFICTPFFIHTCFVPHSCVPCLIHTYAMPHSYVCPASFICVT